MTNTTILVENEKNVTLAGSQIYYVGPVHGIDGMNVIEPTFDFQVSSYFFLSRIPLEEIIRGNEFI